jgi:hypothetical protein
MTSENLAHQRPAAIGTPTPSPTPATPAAPARQARLHALYSRWDQFAAEYEQARRRGDEELMTNLRGLLLLIKKEIVRLGGEQRRFPASEDHLLADL